MSQSRSDLLRKRLEDVFQPQELLIKDQSQLHVGHDGAVDGKGHFEVRIVSAHFTNVGRVRRHQMIYAALGGLLESDIHALRIKAFAPSES